MHAGLLVDPTVGCGVVPEGGMKGAWLAVFWSIIKLRLIRSGLIRLLVAEVGAVRSF